MYTRTKGQVIPDLGTVYPKLVGPIDDCVVIITRHEPEHHLLAFSNFCTLKLNVTGSGPAHVRERRLITNDLRDH